MMSRSTAIAAGVLGLLLVTATVVAAAAPQPPGVPTPASRSSTIVKNEAWARVLGERLFWDTVDVISGIPSASRVALPATGAADGAAESAEPVAVRATRALLARRSLEQYLWLIERAFDDSLWKGMDRIQVERNFALMWRVSTLLYEATLDSHPAVLRVCKAVGEEEFECTDEQAPARMVPIPAAAPVGGAGDQPVIG